MFEAYLKKFVLVFFYDILVYSPDLPTHIEHLREILETLRHHQLLAKKKKFAFGLANVGYLRHVILGLGVAIDPSMIQAMLDWPTPTTLKSLRGFLKMTGYYRRFVKNYRIIC